MKAHSKILVLVVAALFLTLTACSRSASEAPVAVPSPTVDVDFPFETVDPVSAASTQTAIALAPLPEQPTDTPEVATSTPESAEPQAGTDATPVPADDSAQPSAPAATLAPLERPQTYTLKQGEWPICIARRYDLDITSFFQLNGMNMNSKPDAGVTLKIPATGNWSTANFGARSLRQHPVAHTVTAGQSVYSIACLYGDVAPEQILSVNGLANASDVRAGATINIP